MTPHKHSGKDPSSPPQQNTHQQRSALWVVLVLFISGWMFFLGVLVGRGTAPALFDYNKIETEIAALAKTYSDGKKNQTDIAADISGTQAELGYAVELKKSSEDFAKMQLPLPEKPVKPAETPKPLQQEPTQALPKPELRISPPLPVKTESVERGVDHPPDSIKAEPEIKIKSMYDIKAPASKELSSERHAPEALKPQPLQPDSKPVSPKPFLPSPDSKTASTKPLLSSNESKPAPQKPISTPPDSKPSPPKQLPPVPDSRAEAAQPVAIHLSSLVDKKSADALIESLRSKGISASKTPKMLPGKGVWYMVVIGKYASSTEADAVMNRLKQENVDAALVKQ